MNFQPVAINAAPIGNFVSQDRSLATAPTATGIENYILILSDDLRNIPPSVCSTCVTEV